MALAGEELEELGARPHRRRRVRRRGRRGGAGLRLGRGEHRAHVWFSDLGYEYVRINAEYTT